MQYLRQLQYDSRPGRSRLLPHHHAHTLFCSRDRACRHAAARRLRQQRRQRTGRSRRRRSRSSHERVPIGSPLKLTYRFDVAPNAKIDGDYWVFVHVLEPDGEQLWADDHLPPTPTSDVEAGAEGRIHAHGLRPELSVHRPGGRAARPLRPEDQQAPDAGGRAGVPQGVPGRQVRAAAAVGEHLPDLQGGLAPGGGRRRTIPTPSGSGPRSPPRSRSGTRRRTGRCISSTPARVDKFTPPQQVTLRIGDQPIGTLRRDVEGPDARHLPGHRRAVRDRRRRRAHHRRRQDLHARRLRYARARASRSSTPL